MRRIHLLTTIIHTVTAFTVLPYIQIDYAHYFRLAQCQAKCTQKYGVPSTRTLLDGTVQEYLDVKNSACEACESGCHQHRRSHGKGIRGPSNPATDNGHRFWMESSADVAKAGSTLVSSVQLLCQNPSLDEEFGESSEGFVAISLLRPSGPTRFVLQWKQRTQAMGFYDESQWITASVESDTLFKVKGLIPGVQYRFMVTAVGPGGRLGETIASSWTEISSAGGPRTSASALTIRNGYNSDRGITAHLEWPRTAQDSCYYKLQLSNNTLQLDMDIVLDASSSILLPHLEFDCNYAVSLATTASDRSQIGKPVTTNFKSLQCKDVHGRGSLQCLPEAVSDLSIVVRSNGSASISWKPSADPENILFYQLLYHALSSENGCQEQEGIINIEASATSAVVDFPGENCEYVVRLVNYDVVGRDAFLEEHDPSNMTAGTKQSSFVTVFALWNTMMGVSLISMPWALNQAGLFFGFFIFLAMGLLNFYTTYIVIQSPKRIRDKVDHSTVEFTEICRIYLGRVGEITAIIFSMFILAGAILAYYVLMSNFLYFTGKLIYQLAHPSNETVTMHEPDRCGFHCQMDQSLSPDQSYNSTEPPILFGLRFDQIWQLRLTVPILLAIVTFPVLNIKSPTFFTKFNVLGTISVLYLIFFNAAHLIKCGAHVSFTDAAAETYAAGFHWNFPALTGTLTLSYFIHNCIITIMRHQQNPENNTRDLCIGFGLVAFSYIFVAVTFYLAFPFQKSCIHDNLLNNFSAGYAYSAVARILILFQLCTILPLIAFFVRTQLSCFIFKKSYPGFGYVLLLSVTVVVCGALIAIFFPNIGSIIRYVGAVSGMMYSYALPCLVYMQEERAAGTLTPLKIIIHSVIIIFGVANLIAQFLL
ncbi:hypothetical protein RB195_012341 [Necator americanus]|uniref:Fibronectin type-III domain-containing protein n=1 Tax=Necator americanus TaxID=51031 RepID=A0ABR1D6R8_NECAM